MKRTIQKAAVGTTTITLNGKSIAGILMNSVKNGINRSHPTYQPPTEEDQS
ncbi:hypothetical protein GCM10008934_02370 [Virgibacillus salarius]